MSDLHPVKTILILSANPKGTTPLRLSEEIRDIKEGLRRAKRREQFVIESAEAVRYRDIHRAFLDFEPHILHFSGHGAGEEGLVFEDETGQEKLVNGEALAELFELFSDKLECVVLNACYSEVQALEIAKYIPYVVGMKKAIGDKAAIEFALGFYDALGAGKDYVFAHKLGCSAVKIAVIKENLTPVLIQVHSSSSSINSQPNEPISSEQRESKDYYINRPPIEDNCFQEIQQQGALLRIKASQKMGKSLLLKKIFESVEPKNYSRVRIDLQLLESSIKKKRLS